MSVPNHRFIVEDLYDHGDYDLTSHEGQARFVDDAVVALHAHDQRWGFLKKTGSGAHIHGHSEDGALYLSDTPGQSQHVDFGVNFGRADARVGWQPDIPRYSRSDWYPPSEHPPLDEPEQPKPEPPHVCPPCPPVPPTFPYPDENTHGKSFQQRVKQAYTDAGRLFPDPNDQDAFRHFMRYGYSARSMPESEAADKHIAELRAQLGLS